MNHPLQAPGATVETYHAPGSLSDALELLAGNPTARPIAGGTDLMVELDRGVGGAEPVTLIDLTRIPGLDEIQISADAVRIGALVTHNDVVIHRDLAPMVLPLVQACLEVGSPALRNRATVVGNVVTASPANDSLSALNALDAVVHIASKSRSREVPIAQFTTGVRQTVLEPGELVTAISIPRDPQRRAVYAKLGLRRAQAISVVHLAVSVWLNAQGTVTDARIAIGSVAPTIIRAVAAEAALVGQAFAPPAIAASAAAAAAEISPIDDLRAPAEYRRDMTEVLVRRCLTALQTRTEAQLWPDRSPTLRITDRHPIPPTKVTLSGLDPISVTVNGSVITAPNAVSMNLLDWLRGPAHNSDPSVSLRGAQEGCAEGECGACTVIMDGQAVLSCLIPAARANEDNIITIEGIANNGRLSNLQAAFVDHTAVQCGFCIPGFLVSGSALAEEMADPSDAQIDLALSGNLCRCTGYYKIRDAVREATRGGIT